MQWCSPRYTHDWKFNSFKQIQQSLPKLTIKVAFTFYLGFLVTFHPPNELAQFSKNYFIVSPNRGVLFRVTPKLIYTSPDVHAYSPHVRHCYFDFERQLRFFKQYTQVLHSFMSIFFNFPSIKEYFYSPEKLRSRVCRQFYPVYVWMCQIFNVKYGICFSVTITNCKNSIFKELKARKFVVQPKWDATWTQRAKHFRKIVLNYATVCPHVQVRYHFRSFCQSCTHISSIILH